MAVIDSHHDGMADSELLSELSHSSWQPAGATAVTVVSYVTRRPPVARRAGHHDPGTDWRHPRPLRMPGS